MATTDLYDPNEFDRPSVTVDVVILTVADAHLGVLVHRRPEDPYAGAWALPGGFVQLDETLEDAARRVLRVKGGLEDVWLEQLYTFGDLDRDPRTRVLSVSYMALVDVDRFRGSTAEDADTAVATIVEHDGDWQVTVDGTAAALAFDHERIVTTAVERLRGKLDWTPVGYQLLPDEFTLRDLQAVHEVVGGARLNKQSFRRRMLNSGELEDTGRLEEDVSHRPASFYRFVGGGAA